MGGAAGIPVAFAIPRDAMPSDPGNANDRVLWRLQVIGEVPGVDYSAAFEVPVFRTSASDAPAHRRRSGRGRRGLSCPRTTASRPAPGFR